MTEPALPKSKVPRVLSHYRLGKVLGSGGMGTVYQAIDRRDKSTVAVKLLHPHLAGDETFRERFEREAHVGALLRSPYTVHLLDYGFAGGYYFIVMEYVEGQTVKEALQDGPLEVRRSLHIGAQVARALEEAGARGVVHRDIKPENVLLGPGDSVKVSDFGIARQAGRATLTVAGGFVGTLAYAAPELALGKADHRSDIYSLGATLYHVLTGRPPYSGDILEILRHHRETPLPLEPLGGLPAPVVDVLKRCLEKDPERRHQSASDLAAALEHALHPEEASTTVAAIETPGAAEIEATRPIEATEPAATAALGTAVTLELGPPKASGPWGPRLGSTSYELVLRNDSDESVELQLAAEDSESRCSFSLPGRVSVPARGTTTANLKVRPRKRRWRGGRETRQFTVSADGGGGVPPTTVSSQFDDLPYGWMPYGGGILSLAVAAAVIAAIFLTVLGGEDDSGPAALAPSPTPGLTAGLVATPPPSATPDIIYRSPSGYPVDPTTATLIVDGSMGSRGLVEGGPSVQVYSERQQVGSDPGRANAAGWNCRTHQEYIGQPAVDWYLPKATRVLSSLDGTATLYVNTVVNTFDYYGVPAEPYLGNPDRSRASTNPFPGPNGGKGVWVEVASDSFVARYVHLDVALTTQVVSPGAYIDGYSASFDFESSFATPRPFTEGTLIASWQVRRGDVIGSTGDSGYAEGPQLHYDVTRVGDSNRLCPTDESGFPDNGWLRNQDPDRLARGSEEPLPEEAPREEQPTGIPETDASEPVDVTFDVPMGDNFFQPNRLEVGAGQSFRIDLVNNGEFVHNLRIVGADDTYDTGDDLASTPDVQRSGETGQLVGRIDEPGVYNFRCDFHPIEMVGTITVR